jgi:hypothetical protein
MIWDHSSTVENQNAITINNRGYVGAEPISVFINNNKLNCAQQVRNGAVRVGLVTGNPFNDLRVSENVLYGATIVLAPTSLVNHWLAERAVVQNNLVFRGYEGIRAQGVKNITVQNNLVRDVATTPIYTTGRNDANRADIINVSGNVVVDAPKVGTSSSTTNRIIMAWYAVDSYINGNIGGTFGETIDASTATGFVEGETVTGGTSGAAAVVQATNGPRIGIGLTRVGTFTGGETITGSVSGATATVTSVSLTASEFGSYFNTTNLYRGQNTNTGAGTADQLGTITNDKFQFIAPAYTTTARDALAAPMRGQVIINTTTGKLNFYTGTAWEAVTST